MRSNTLTRSLFYRIAPTILITICLIGVLAFKGATREINHVYDAQLISSANMLWLVVEDEMSVDAERFRRIRKIDLNVSNQKSLNEFADAYADSRMFRVWKGNKLAMISDKAPTVGIPQQEGGLSDVKDDLSRFLREAETRDIVITRHGKPAGVLIGFASEDDWFDYRLENDPQFLRRVHRARSSLRAGCGVRVEDV